MSSKALYQALIQELGYAESTGFVEQIPWYQKEPIAEVTAVYLTQDVPVIYFSCLTADVSSEKVWQLYRKVWNESKVPLLVVVLPQEIRVYNTFAEPVQSAAELDEEQSRLLRCVKSLSGLIGALEIGQELGDYNRLQLDTRAFWATNDGQRVQYSKRADQRLLSAMDGVRRELLASHLSNYTAYALLGRSIFIRYLEDRQILTSAWFCQVTNGKAESYGKILQDIETTYFLFSRLSERFNGDLFPVDEQERQEVKPEHLALIAEFLAGTVKGQLSFWPFDFNYIPIELISGIYDTFLSPKKQKELGAYYTPLPLVDFVLDETLPKEALHSEMTMMTILDPACGSGVFLVRAYQRLVESQPQSKKGFKAKYLGSILKRTLFGVDKSPEAVRIAAFSLYLAMLDYLEKEEILAAGFRFPSLHGSNLLVADFFSPQVDAHFASHNFLRVVGNPPWGRGTLKGDSAKWVEKKQLPVGDKQIAQAFLWRAAEFCAAEGEIALLAPAKSTILVSRPSHEAFRRHFFEAVRVRAVVNLAGMRHELFMNSASPTIAIFYQPLAANIEKRIAYGVPKPSPLSQHLGAIVLETTDVKFLQYEELLSWPLLWKVALWGSPRDAALIRRLQSYPTLEEQAAKQKWKIYVGYEAEYKGSAKYKAPWLEGQPVVSPQHFRAYLTKATQKVRQHHFHRPRQKAAFQPPLVLIRRSTSEAAFSKTSIAYRNKITGIVGQAEDADLLKWLTAYLNSPLAKYIHFLTSTSWAVERDTIIHDEYKQMPFLVPDKDDVRLQQVLRHVDQIMTIYEQHDAAALSNQGLEAYSREHEIAIAELVFDIFDFTPTERQLVADMMDYGVDYFQWSKRKSRKPLGTKAVQPPNLSMLRAYAEAFIESATTFLSYQDKSLNAYLYQNRAPLTIIEFEVTTLQAGQQVNVYDNIPALKSLLRELNQWLIEQKSPDIYRRRHVRLYHKSSLYLVRPSQARFWTISQARADADDLIDDLLSQ